MPVSRLQESGPCKPSWLLLDFGGQNRRNDFACLKERHRPGGVVEMKQEKVKTYKPEFKEFSVKMALGSDKPIAQTAKDLGVNPNTLRTWVNKYTRANQGIKTARPDERLHKELTRLKTENARLKGDINMLRKAAACFAGVLAV
jgi:transposase